MTTVEVVRRDGHIVRVTSDGHTDYGEEGEDIVCAALSSVIQTAALGLFRVAGIKAVTLDRDDRAARFSMELGDMSARDRRAADLILDTMLCGIADLHEGFSKFIKLEVHG
ncbi:MAG: ribosomal-processing cysteine protease Prp [Clostridia bacterium]|nr:ribosomal-processing cysteine protease Prp [Clostridia bacterium]